MLRQISDVDRVEARQLPSCEAGDDLFCLFLKLRDGTEQEFPIWFTALARQEAQRTADSLNHFLNRK
jgi:hypothetical protein